MEQSMIRLFKMLGSEPGIGQFKKCIEEWEYDYNLIKEDVNEEESDLRENIAPLLFNKIKKLVNTDEDEQDSPSDNLQILMNILSKSPRKNAVAILQRKINEDQYDWDNIVDDIRDEENSDILDELRNNNVDQKFVDIFCNAVYSIDDKLNKDIDDDWESVYDQLKKIDLFKNDIYRKVIDYFRNERWTVNLYLENELELNDTDYSQSQFHEICPDLSDQKREMLMKVFNAAITRSVSCIKPPIRWHRGTNHLNIKQCDCYSDTNNGSEDEKNDEYNKRKTYVDNDDHEDYMNMKRLMDNIHKITNTPDSDFDDNSDYEFDKDLKKLCTIFGPNNVLLMNDIRSRQAMIAFCNPDFEIMCAQLSVYEEKRYKNDIFWNYVRNPQTLRRKYCDEKKLNDYSNAFIKLQATRWLGDGKTAQMMANNRSYDQQTLYDDSNDVKWNIIHINNDADDVDDNDNDDSDDDPNLDIIGIGIGIDDHRIIGSAREGQIFLYGFILGISRKILERFDELNCDLCLDLKFPTTLHNNNYQIKNRFNYPLSRLDRIILQFERVFDDPLLSKEFINNMIQRKLCHFKINMTDPIPIKPIYKGLNRKEIGFKLPTDWKEYDNIHLWHLMRIKKQFIGRFDDLDIDENGNYREYKRIGLAFLKLGRSIKYYLIFQGSMLRILPKDIVQWIHHLFLYKHDHLSWKEMAPILKDRLNDYKSLENKYDATIEANNYEPNLAFYQQIKQWSEIDMPYHQKSEQFTPKCREFITSIDRKYDYSFKIQNDYKLK